LNIFYTDEEAYDYLWRKIENELKYAGSIPPTKPPENFLW
jgi:hypothetical protein